MLIRITDTVGTTGSVTIDTDTNYAHIMLAPLFEDSPREVQDAVIEVSALIDRGTLFTDPTGPGLLHYLGLSAERSYVDPPFISWCAYVDADDPDPDPALYLYVGGGRWMGASSDYCTRADLPTRLEQVTAPVSRDE